jgi:hypothetical protein
MGRALLPLALAFPMSCLMPAHATADGQSKPEDVAQPKASRHHKGSSLEDRVKTLSRVLDLDAQQQLELSKVLEGQREQVNKVWNDPSLPASYRVVATQAISDKTADQIRALLNEEQRKKYKPPRQHDSADASARPNVEDWMSPRPKPAAPSANR